MSSVPLERIWAPVDAIRHGLLRTVVDVLGGLGRRLIADRQLRVALTATFAVALALAFTTLIPMWMLALGPIILGVPHVIGDVRAIGFDSACTHLSLISSGLSGGLSRSSLSWT